MSDRDHDELARALSGLSSGDHDESGHDDGHGEYVEPVNVEPVYQAPPPHDAGAAGESGSSRCPADAHAAAPRAPNAPNATNAPRAAGGSRARFRRAASGRAIANCQGCFAIGNDRAGFRGSGCTIGVGSTSGSRRITTHVRSSCRPRRGTPPCPWRKCSFCRILPAAIATGRSGKHSNSRTFFGFCPPDRPRLIAALAADVCATGAGTGG